MDLGAVADRGSYGKAANSNLDSDSDALQMIQGYGSPDPDPHPNTRPPPSPKAKVCGETTALETARAEGNRARARIWGAREGYAYFS